ncbi:MAG: pilus assembly protein PilM [Candidatus Parabeggiatoa sp. nov. 1]|nr:MAG: pilus assembly protein PilM [Gammaproteobacteria bacterium]
MSLFSLKPEPIVGIDISSTAVKLLELSKAGKGYKVESYAMEPLPEKAIEDKNIVDGEIVGDAISRVVKRAKPKAQHAAIAVAGPAVITKTIQMEKDMSDDDMKEQIGSDPAQYLGKEGDEIHFDFYLMGPNEKEPEERVDVLLAACSSEMLEARTAALEQAGLKTKIVDIEKYALENAFVMVAQNDPEILEGETIALIEVGATTTTINVLSDQKIVYTHEEMFGGKQLTEQIQARYELTYDEANKMKREGGLPENYETEILEPFKDEMADQISRMVKYYYAQSTYGKQSHVLIAGGCASISGIVEQVSNKVGGHVTIVNPVASMSVASRVSKKALMNDAPALMIACGLALRNFD